MNEPVATVRQVSGIQTGVSITGRGRPVLALHGWGGSIRSFWPVAERLAELGYQTHLLDFPGFGHSAMPPAIWGVADFAQFVLAYLDQAGLDNVSILGHSFGGRVCLVLAANHPDRVHRMVLANSAGLKTPPSFRRRVRYSVARLARNSLDFIGLAALRARLQDRYNRRFASEDYLNAGALRETFVRVIDEDLTAYAVRVKAPTVLIWGDGDQDTPLWQGKKLEQLIPDAGLVVFQGAGHFSYLERLPDFIRIVDHFFSEGS